MRFKNIKALLLLLFLLFVGSGRARAGEVTVYVTRTGAKYHRAGCRYLRKSAMALDLRNAAAVEYTPCAVCKPRVFEKRSSAERARFMRETGYARGRPGYIVDHIVPLACGGADDPSNMQWLVIEEAKAKDKWERQDCR